VIEQLLMLASSSGRGLYDQQARLQASDAAAGDSLGYATALSSDGNTCAVGACTDDNTGGTDAGSVYVFTRSGAAWTQQARLQAADAAASDRFGYSVALSSDGNTCAIGAMADSNSGGSFAGSVYVFTRSGSTWVQQARLQAGDAAADDQFGFCVALSSDGNTCVVGANRDDNTGGTNTGSAYIFTRSGSTWTQQARLQAGDVVESDNFGYAAALSSDGNTCAVGAPYFGSASAGAVYIYTRSGTTWTQQAQLHSSDAGNFDFLGTSVALSSDGNLCVTGAEGDNNTGGTDAGSVYVFTRSGATWTQQARLQAADAEASDRFGYSVALSSDGNTCAIGAMADSNSGGNFAGSAYVFTRSGSTWVQQTRLQAADAAANDQFGFCVALSSTGRTISVGAPYKTSSVGGSAYVYLW
jgi:predicted NBD/HSP70 family sugar kinase